MGNLDDEINVLPSKYEKPIEHVQSTEVEDSVAESFDERQEPSDDDLARLRRISEPIPLRAWFLATFACLIIGLSLWSNYVNGFPSMDARGFGGII